MYKTKNEIIKGKACLIHTNKDENKCVGVALLGDPRKDSAITLIALVITIIVLLILAGITLTFILGQNGLFDKAKNAKTSTIQAQAEEDINLKILEYQAGNDGVKPTLKQLATSLGTEYKIATTEGGEDVSSDIENNINDSTTQNIWVTKNSIGAEVKVSSNLQVEATNKVETGTSGNTSSNSGTNSNNGSTSPTHNGEISFGNGNTGGFTATMGTVDFKSYGLTYNAFPSTPDENGEYYIICDKAETKNLGKKFEFSMQLVYKNANAAESMWVGIELMKNDESVLCIDVGEGSSSVIRFWSHGYYLNNTPCFATVGPVDGCTNNNGRYALVGDGTKVHLYVGTDEINNTSLLGDVEYDTVRIYFCKKENNPSPAFIESLYIGEPLYYKDFVD